MINYLYERRVELGLTQRDICNAVGVSIPTVSKWETGRISNMRKDKIAAYAEVLHTTPEFIMTGQEKKEIDDFSYALFCESHDLPEDKKQMLLDMARFMHADIERQRKAEEKIAEKKQSET